MSSKIYKLLMGTVMMMVMLFTINNINVKAANCNVGVSSINGVAGETIVVNVTVTADEAAAGQIGVSYDTNYLDYVGSDSSDVSGGQAGIVLIVSADIPASGYTVPLKFKAKQAGSTNVTIASNTSIFAQMGTSDEPMNYNASNGTITVTAATTASNDSKLSGLSVQAVTSNGDSSNVVYTPSFSPDVTEYKAELASNVTKLVIATTLSDSKSQTAVSGTRIDPGNNKTTVTVTAEDGSVTKYTLYTVRSVETTTEPSTSGEEESTTVEEFDRTPKKIEALNKYIIQDFTLTTIPEGFEEGTTTYEGQTIAVLKGIAKPLKLMCLADDAQGTNIEKYIYNEVSGAIDKMIDITSMQKMYTILPTGPDYPGPTGYTQTELDVKGNKVRAWVKSAESEFYVVYAMNWNGETSLYAYDTKEQTMQRFVEGNKTENVEDMPQKENTEYLLMKKQYDEMYDEYVNDHQKKNKQIVILLIAVIVIMVIATIVIYLLYKKNAMNGYENVDAELNNEHEEDDEINLDFVEVSNNDVKARQTNLDVALNNISKREAKDVQTLEESDEIGFEAAIEESSELDELEQKENIDDIEIGEVEEKSEEIKEEKSEENTLGTREEIKASATDILDALDTQSLKDVMEETSKTVVEDEDDELEIEFFDLDD